jgi:MFS family permease
MPGSGAGRGWFFLLLTVSTLLQAATAAARPMTSYRALDIGMPPSTLGVVAAAFAIAPVILALSIGRRIDRNGEFPFLLAAAGVLSVSAALLAFVDTPVTLLAVVAVLGLSQLVFVVANQTLVGSRSPAATYDERFGHLSFVASLGQLIGPTLAGLVAGDSASEGTARALFVGAGLAALALPAIVLLWRRDPGPVSMPGAGDEVALSIMGILRRPGMGAAMLASMTVLATMDVLVVYLPLLGEERGLTVATVGVLLGVRAGASMVSRFMLGRLIGWFGRDRLMIGSLVIAAISVMSLAVLPLPAMFVAMAIAGLTLGVCQPMTMSWVAARATAGARATAMSVRLLGNRVGQVVIPLAAGTLAAVTGTAGVLAVAGMTVVFSAAVVARRRDRGSRAPIGGVR